MHEFVSLPLCKIPCQGRESNPPSPLASSTSFDFRGRREQKTFIAGSCPPFPPLRCAPCSRPGSSSLPLLSSSPLAEMSKWATRATSPHPSPKHARTTRRPTPPRSVSSNILRIAAADSARPTSALTRSAPRRATPLKPAVVPPAPSVTSLRMPTSVSASQTLSSKARSTSPPLEARTRRDDAPQHGRLRGPPRPRRTGLGGMHPDRLSRKVALPSKAGAD